MEQVVGAGVVEVALGLVVEVAGCVIGAVGVGRLVGDVAGVVAGVLIVDELVGIVVEASGEVGTSVD